MKNCENHKPINNKDVHSKIHYIVGLASISRIGAQYGCKREALAAPRFAPLVQPQLLVGFIEATSLCALS